MTDDWYTASIDRVETAADDLYEAIDRAVSNFRAAQVQRRAGADVVDIVKGLAAGGAKEVRLAATTAFRKFEMAVTDYRAQVIRKLVDEEHMSFSEIGDVIGVSRQMVARLYRRSADDAIREARQD
jgi:hypothetical protein